MSSDIAAASHQPTAVPGPRGYPILGVLPEVRRDTLGFLMRSAREYGDVFRFQIGPKRIYLLVHPNYIKHVLQDNHLNYRKAPHYDFLKPLFGEGLITSDGEYWLRQRRLTQPTFHRQRIAGFIDIMTDATTAMLRRWLDYAERSQPLDVAEEAIELTLRILLGAIFGTQVSHETEEIAHSLRVVEKQIEPISSFNPLKLPRALPTKTNRQFKQALRALDSFVYGIIDQRRRTGADTGDLLSTFLLARDEETGEGMNDAQLRDEVMNLLQAGHETVAHLLTWTWYSLSKIPAVDRRLAAEVAGVLGRRRPTVEDLSRLPYTKMVLQESLRLYPPAWVIGRTPIKDDEIGGYRIPANSVVALSPYVTHHCERFWDNPEGFDPERFTPEHSAGRPRFAFFPFGGGPRLCIGESFGMMEAQVVITMVVQAYRLDLIPGHLVIPKPLVLMPPSNGLVMTLHKRSSDAGVGESAS